MLHLSLPRLLLNLFFHGDEGGRMLQLPPPNILRQTFCQVCFTSYSVMAPPARVLLFSQSFADVICIASLGDAVQSRGSR